MFGAITPWANIPWKYKSVWEKTYSILFICSAGYFLFYICVYWISLYKYNKVQSDSDSHAIAILIDTSLSMSAADVLPNRYTHAVSIAQWLVSSFPASYITIPFASTPLVRTPWSTDTAGIKDVLSQYTLWSHHVNDAYMWSAPWNAIWYAWNALRNYKTQKKTIILLWDSSTNTWYSIDSFIPYLQRDKIELYICVIWENEYILWQSYSDTQIKTIVDTGRMDAITKATNGKRWNCNARQSAINQIHFALDESEHSESFLTWLPMDKLHILAVICLWYNIIIILLSLIVYSTSWKENTPNTLVDKTDTTKPKQPDATIL